MDKETASTILKLSSAPILAAAIAIGGKSDSKAVKGLAAGTAVIFGAVAVVTGAVELDDIISTVADATT